MKGGDSIPSARLVIYIQLMLNMHYIKESTDNVSTDVSCACSSSACKLH